MLKAYASLISAADARIIGFEPILRVSLLRDAGEKKIFPGQRTVEQLLGHLTSAGSAERWIVEQKVFSIFF